MVSCSPTSRYEVDWLEEVVDGESGDGGLSKAVIGVLSLKQKKKKSNVDLMKNEKKMWKFTMRNM